MAEPLSVLAGNSATDMHLEAIVEEHIERRKMVASATFSRRYPTLQYPASGLLGAQDIRYVTLPHAELPETLDLGIEGVEDVAVEQFGSGGIRLPICGATTVFLAYSSNGIGHSGQICCCAGNIPLRKGNNHSD
jgi:hypothetical protein